MYRRNDWGGGEFERPPNHLSFLISNRSSFSTLAYCVSLPFTTSALLHYALFLHRVATVPRNEKLNVVFIEKDKHGWLEACMDRWMTADEWLSRWMDK